MQGRNSYLRVTDGKTGTKTWPQSCSETCWSLYHLFWRSVVLGSPDANGSSSVGTRRTQLPEPDWSSLFQGTVSGTPNCCLLFYGLGIWMNMMVNRDCQVDYWETPRKKSYLWGIHLSIYEGVDRGHYRGICIHIPEYGRWHHKGWVEPYLIQEGKKKTSAIIPIPYS